jgi:hypothetical protein
MAVNNSWRQIRTMDDWMRDMEKRLIHEERRPIPRSAYEVVGRGFTPYANQVTDWNSEGPTINGFFYSDADKIINSPDDTDNWVGIVEATPIGQGVQRVWKYVDSSDTDGDGVIDTWTPVADPTLYTRSFITNADGTRTYTAWAAASGGGGGGTTLTIEDEGVSLGTFTTINFTGAGVTATSAGSSEVQVDVPGGTTGQVLTFTFASPLATWTINHNLGTQVIVKCFDSGGTNELYPEIDYPTVNQAVVSWYAPQAGIARVMSPGGPGILVVHHGTNPAVARPSAVVVYWLGTATPANAQAWDFWEQANI